MKIFSGQFVTGTWGVLFAMLAGPILPSRAEDGVTAKRIVIGQSAAFSGPASELGTEMRSGAMAYFEHVNKQGGVHGRRVELVAIDDGYEPERAAANARKLIQGGAFLLFGQVGTPTSNASKPIFTEAQVPFVGPFTGAESLRSPVNRYIFNVRASYYAETDKIVEQLVNLGLTKIAVFYQNDDYGRALANELGVTGRGVGITQVVPFPWNVGLPVVREYQWLFSASSGKSEFSFTSLEGFIAAKVLVEDLRRTGPNLTRERLIATMENFSFDTGRFAVSYPPNDHSGSRFVDLTMTTKEGKFLR